MSTRLKRDKEKAGIVRAFITLFCYRRKVVNAFKGRSFLPKVSSKGANLRNSHVCHRKDVSTSLRVTFLKRLCRCVTLLNAERTRRSNFRARFFRCPPVQLTSPILNRWTVAKDVA